MFLNFDTSQKKSPRRSQRGKVACRYLFQHAFKKRVAVEIGFK